MLDRPLRLGMVTRPGGELAIAQRAQFAAQRLPRDSDTELLPQPLTEIDQPPAHHAMNGGYRTALDGCRLCCAVFRVQPGRWTRSLAINQPLRPLALNRSTQSRMICRPTPPTRAASLRLPPS